MRKNENTGQMECRFNFEFEYNDKTFIKSNGTTVYKRTAPTDTKGFIIKNGKTYTSKNIATFNAYLSLKFGCHINVQRINSLLSQK